MLARPTCRRTRLQRVYRRDVIKTEKKSMVCHYCLLFIFGLMHINPSQVASAFTFGLLLGWLYYKFRSVTPTFCLHALNNIYCAMLDRWGDGSATTSELCRMIHFPLALTIVLSLAIFTFSIWCLDKIAHSE